MNANEGISLAKMALSVLLVCLLLSGVLLMWYLVSGAENAQIESWRKAANSAASERMFELALQSETALSNNQPDNYPLVTNVCSALSEFKEDGVVFVSVYDSSTSTTNVFTYEGLNLDTTTFTGSVSLNTSTVPLTQSASYLLKKYSSSRCFVSKVDVSTDATGKYLKASSEDTFVAYDIAIMY